MMYLTLFNQIMNSHVFKKYIKIVSISLCFIIFNFYFLYAELNKLIKSRNQSLKLHQNERQQGVSQEAFLPGSHFLTQHLADQAKHFESAKIIDSNTLDFFQRIQRKPFDVNCRYVVEWDESEMRNAKRALYQWRSSQQTGRDDQLPDSNFIFNNSYCSMFRSLRGYDNYEITEVLKMYSSQIELNFNFFLKV